MACTLWNWLGTGLNPKLHLELAGNDAGWKTYNINYGASGNFPWNTGVQSASWNVKDEKGAWYGTITLKSNGNEVLWDHYDTGGDHYLKGIHLPPYKGPGAYELKCDEIHPTPTPSTGPFAAYPLATPAVYPPGPPSDRIVLSVSGDKIVGGGERRIPQTVLLTGLCRPSLEWNAQGQYLSLKDIQRLKWWRSHTTCNVIRVSLCQELWFASQPKTVAGSYKQIIDAIIYLSIYEKMAVILDLHRLVVANDGPIMANSKSKQFWAEVAAEYKDFGTVLFELFNEPHDLDANKQKAQDEWLNGNSEKDYAGYQQLYEAVRGAGANNLCIIGGLDWAYDLSFVNDKFRVKGDNIVYCSHPYNPK